MAFFFLGVGGGAGGGREGGREGRSGSVCHYHLKLKVWAPMRRSLPLDALYKDANMILSISPCYLCLSYRPQGEGNDPLKLPDWLASTSSSSTSATSATSATSSSATQKVVWTHNATLLQPTQWAMTRYWIYRDRLWLVVETRRRFVSNGSNGSNGRSSRICNLDVIGMLQFIFGFGRFRGYDADEPAVEPLPGSTGPRHRQRRLDTSQRESGAFPPLFTCYHVLLVCLWLSGFLFRSFDFQWFRIWIWISQSWIFNLNSFLIPNFQFWITKFNFRFSIFYVEFFSFLIFKSNFFQIFNFRFLMLNFFFISDF